jgi:hypothetical protein
MFLTKQDFEDSLRIVQTIEDISVEEVKLAVARDFARELFSEFDKMQENERQEIIEMIINDMQVDFYMIH